MKSKFSLSLVMLLATLAVAYASEIKPYEWEKNRVRYTLTETEKGLAELVLKQHTRYEYVLENDQFLMYSTVHHIVLVNNDEAVKKHNRIVIPMNSALDLTDLKARAINKEGKAVYFDKSNLKELKNEETGNAYRIFAIEGIELGSEIEYYFTRKMRGTVFERVYLQFDVPVKEASFLLSCPPHLKFDFKSYEGLVAVTKNETAERNSYTAEASNIPAMKKEAFSYFDSNRKRIEFKLAYNTDRSQARLYTWDEAAKTFYTILYSVSKDDEKAVDKFIKTLGDKPGDKIEARIRNVEQKIKTSVKVSDQRSEESLDRIEDILKSRIASRDGITKLMLSVYGKLGIGCQPVITCSRESIRFDGKFDSWSYLDEYALYFPVTKGFLAPYEFKTRYPLIPADWTAQQALFIEPLVVGELKSALASIAEIPAADYKLSSDELDINVTFNEDLSSTNIHQKHLISGYNAQPIAPYYHLMTEDQRKEMAEDLTRQSAPDAKLKSWDTKVYTDRETDAFFIDTDFESTSFVERAGPRVLFKAGELIGPQIEMYRDDQRLTAVENEFNRAYDRKIRINIPAGYTVKNAQDVKIDITYKDGDKTPFLFQSDYAVTDKGLEVTIREYYKQISAPVDRYEDFRKVINAAADFNKVTLVLEKTRN